MKKLILIVLFLVIFIYFPNLRDAILLITFVAALVLAILSKQKRDLRIAIAKRDYKERQNEEEANTIKLTANLSVDKQTKPAKPNRLANFYSKIRKLFIAFILIILAVMIYGSIPDNDDILDYASSLQEACVKNHECRQIQPPPQNVLRVMGLKVSKDEFTFYVPLGFDAKFASGGVNKDLTIGMDDDPDPQIYKCLNEKNNWICRQQKTQ